MQITTTARTEDVVKRLTEVHGGKYIYDQTSIGHTKTKIPIQCPEHGVFWQKLASHLHGQGCPKCANAERGKKYTWSTDDFIRRAKKEHGDRYDYSRVNYVKTRTPVEIICPTHGSFFQAAYRHIATDGCPSCSAVRRGYSSRDDLDVFTAKAKVAHGNKYDYDKVVYNGSYAKVSIICPKHGLFQQRPNQHVKGGGCPTCGGKLLSNTEEFVSKAAAVHNDVYDYSESVYVTAKTPIKIICRKHGAFLQTPNNHLNGQDCPLCNERLILDTEEYVRRAKNIHGDVYDYSKVNYINAVTSITIGCNFHGDFKQSAAEHIRGRGCSKCAAVERGKNLTLSTAEFLDRATIKHGKRFDYSQTEYVNCMTPVKIKCPKHGSFLQLPLNHLNGTGCPICSSSRGELFIAKILGENNINFVCEYKIPNVSYRFRYDFFLPDHNLLIEYHGVQHYQPVVFFGGEEGYHRTVGRDALKKSIARTLRYSYTEVSYKAYLGLPEEVFVSRLLEMIAKAKTKFSGSKKFLGVSFKLV